MDRTLETTNALKPSGREWDCYGGSRAVHDRAQREADRYHGYRQGGAIAGLPARITDPHPVGRGVRQGRGGKGGPVGTDQVGCVAGVTLIPTIGEGRCPA